MNAFARYGRLAIFSVCMLLSASIGRADPTYHYLNEIDVGGAGGWDYMTVDDAAHRLYVTHGDKIVVIDTRTDTVVGEIADTPGVHGFAVAPDLQRGFSSNGREGKVSIVDLKTLQTTGKVGTGKNPDAIIYASGPQEVYAFNGKDQSATVFDAKSGNVVTTIALPGTPEFAAYDPVADMVYDNIENKNEVVEINAKTHEIVNTWPVAPGAEATGLAVDLDHHRLFIGCRNRLMVMMDSTSGKVMASVPIGERVDATAFEPGAQRAFCSNGDGTLTIAYEDSPDKLVVVQDLMTQKGARTMALDLQTKKVYLATAKFQASPANGPAPSRPTPIPGTFKILVYGE